MQFIDEPARQTPVYATTQVLVVGGGRIGDMPHDKAMKNMELFAREVMPHFRSTTGHGAQRASDADITTA